jgi:hypothetical protein
MLATCLSIAINAAIPVRRTFFNSSKNLTGPLHRAGAHQRVTFVTVLTSPPISHSVHPASPYCGIAGIAP